jgi:NAD(P)-dependent dehydrogenase (short-subunit alcohol dehydrogenase family)
VEVMALDLADFASIRSFAHDFLASHDRLDVLLENAGLVQSQRSTTAQGFETTFGVNHIGHFLLTDLLLDRLKASAPSRVVIVASGAHKSARGGLDFDDLQTERHRYHGMQVYSRTKLANVYFARELARRLAGTGVTVNALHPGFVASNFAREGDTGLMSAGIRIARPFAISAPKGALTSIYLASSPEVEGITGQYFSKCKPASTSKTAQDDNAGRRLWEATEELVANAGA